ncbi:uncharacterized protein LOC109846852 [Asparagus officinalis]|uniref:uncharacterized protein LOC109846852 n=1 Tax=Asparagus officinalis TaxID=4686 RepID=UPI00098DF3CB|nr:uncharacterized protein LOC109846852 [Asparagus officinalis]
MTFLFCKWLIATNIVTRRRRISDSEEEVAPRQATEVTCEAVMSPRGKEAAESSRKGKEPACPTDSEEEFDSEEIETSEGTGEADSSSEEAAGLPDSFFERGLVRPSAAPAQPQDAPKKRRERVVMTHPNRMTVEVLSGDEEDTVPLAHRQRSQSSTQAQTQIPPGTELRTKRRHEGSEARPPKRQKNVVSKPRVHLPVLEETSGRSASSDVVSKPRVHLPVLEETSGRSASSDEQGSQEEGENRVEAVSPGGMETEETSFVQQMQDALKEGPASVPPISDIDPLASNTVKLKEAGASSGALDSVPVNEGPVIRTDTAIITGTSDTSEGRDLVPWVGTEFDLQSSVLESQPATPMDPMMIEVTVTPQISPVATKARPTEEVGTSADVVPRVESPLKEPINLDPKFSEVEIEKSSDVAGTSKAVSPEPTLAVQEAGLPLLGEQSHAEGSSVKFAPPSSLSDRIQALLADEDPDKAVICSDLQGFVHFLNTMIDRILFIGSPFENFKRPLDHYISEIREEGYGELADLLSAYLVDLRQHVELLKDFRTKGVPSYIASQMDSRLQVWRDSQTSANSELQKLRARSNQLRVSVGRKTQAKVNRYRDLESSQAEIARLEEQLAKANDAHEILESDLAKITQAEESLFQQLNIQDQILAEKEREVAELQSVDEEAFKVKLTAKLEHAYALELSKLEDQINTLEAGAYNLRVIDMLDIVGHTQLRPLS